MKQDPAALVNELCNAFNAKDMGRIKALCTADAQMTTVPFDMKVGFEEDCRAWATAFPDGTLELVNLVVQGDRVMAEFIGRGTHTGPLQGPSGEIAPTRRKVELPLVESYALRGDKIASARMYFDALGFFRQLGIGERAQPQPATPAPH